MTISRRAFLAQSLVLLTPSTVLAAMSHIVLLGDSIFDNGSYTNGKPDVVTQVRDILPGGWKASLLAVDGATTRGIDAQLARLPADASHLVMSVGGNDALAWQHILKAPVRTTAEALTLLSRATAEFESDYRKAVSACLKRGLPLTICTIYNGNFPDPAYQRQVATALTAFNDVIIGVGVENGLSILELRKVCTKPADYANPIEPSSIGGAKIASAIVRLVTVPAEARRGGGFIGGAGQ